MENKLPQISFGIVGSGTAGLIAALLLRKAFPISPITIISSSEIGIIGVGEGSTEHWRGFMELCEIPLEEMLSSTLATHKYGIRFENWSDKNPDYFHSVGGIDDIYAFGLLATYMGFIEQGKMLTSQTSSVGLIKNKINRQNLHNNTNQYHFDTFRLNEYFSHLCFERSIKFIDGKVDETGIELDSEAGCIKTVKTTRGETCHADFWFDATGFNRVLMKKLGNDNWKSFSDFLLCDSAIAFPTESDPSGQIRPYTRARAASSGWMWEIPTQERRGNGYVFSSQFLTEEQAVAEATKMTGYNIEQYRSFKFNAGHIKDVWVKNCCAIGLSSSFVEPLEATSIGSTIQQIKHIIPYLASYQPTHTASQKHYNKSFNKMMRNILSMIRLHYYSDKRNSPFWIAQSNMPLNEDLQEILDLWAERPPSRLDYESNSGEMFLTPHMVHVAQGQDAISKEACTRALNNLNIRQHVKKEIDEIRHRRHAAELVDHAEALREINSIDSEWN
jgi:tryptophan halogenase